MGLELAQCNVLEFKVVKQYMLLCEWEIVTINLTYHWMASLFYRITIENSLIWSYSLTFIENY